MGAIASAALAAAMEATAELAQIASEWLSWTPTLTWESAIPSGVVTLARYKFIGKTIFVSVNISATDGNNATGVSISLPQNYLPKTNNIQTVFNNQVVIGSGAASKLAYIRDDGSNNDIYFFYLGQLTDGEIAIIRGNAAYECA